MAGLVDSTVYRFLELKSRVLGGRPAGPSHRVIVPGAIKPITKAPVGLQVNDHIVAPGDVVFRHACQLGFEGIVWFALQAAFSAAWTLPPPALRMPTIYLFPACCARAASGHAAAPPSSVMNSRRRITRSPRRRARAAYAGLRRFFLAFTARRRVDDFGSRPSADSVVAAVQRGGRHRR